MRLEGWESRLVRVIEAARNKPYALGEHDCFLMACATVEALTGVNPGRAWVGRYKTKREALRRIAEYGGNFRDAASKLFATPVEKPGMARRGDIVLYMANGEPHLGICEGSRCVIMLDIGLAFASMSDRNVQACWRIG